LWGSPSDRHAQAYKLIDHRYDDDVVGAGGSGFGPRSARLGKG
jgi:hypothetical protein